MTEKQYKDAQEKLADIYYVKQKISLLADFRSTLDRKYRSEDEEKIQTATDAQHPTQAIVRICSLIEYIDNEIDFYKMKKDELEKEFSEI